MMIKHALGIGLITLCAMQTNAIEPNDSEPDYPPAVSDEHALRVSLSIDNDLFAPRNSDKDYTAGIAITFQNLQHNGFTSLFDQPLNALDQFLDQTAAIRSYNFEVGSYGFTPDDIESTQLDRTDRPYASIVYLSASRHYQQVGSDAFWTSAFTLGALGLEVFKSGQDTVHKLITGDKARGWNNQISEGGELTARYQLAYHAPLPGSAPNHQLKMSVFGSVGYLTEAGAALSFRRGLISSPDYRFNPAITSYGEHTNAVDAGSDGHENYFWAGVGLKYRAYNAFLEGQFRDSAHTIRRSNLRPVIAELWAGYTLSVWESTKLSYIFRAHSSEIKSGAGNRNLMWGGFVLSTAFN